MTNHLTRVLICLIFIAGLTPWRGRTCSAQSAPELRTPPGGTGSWKSTYDRAVELDPKGDRELSRRLLEQVRKDARRLRITFNAILVSDEFARSSEAYPPPSGEKGRVLVEVEPGAQSILGKKIIEVIPNADLAAGALLESAACENKQMRIVASFFINACDTQRVELKLTPDRAFHHVTRDSAAPPESGALAIAFRPVVSPDGKAIRIDFYDWINANHVFSPKTLSSVLTWSHPASDAIALGPPQFDLENQAILFKNSVQIPDGGYFMVSRIHASGEREITESLPVLGKLPLLKNFLSKRRIEKEQAHLILVFRPIIERR